MRSGFLLFAVLLAADVLAEEMDIHKTIKARLPDAIACYETTLKKNPQAKGRIFVDWDVNEKGTVNKAKVNDTKTTLKDLELQTCLLEKLKRWTFPAAPPGMVANVSYPFKFGK